MEAPRPECSWVLCLVLHRMWQSHDLIADLLTLNEEEHLLGFHPELALVP